MMWNIGTKQNCLQRSWTMEDHMINEKKYYS